MEVLDTMLLDGCQDHLPAAHVPVIEISSLMDTDVDFSVHLIGDSVQVEMFHLVLTDIYFMSGIWDSNPSISPLTTEQQHLAVSYPFGTW